MNAIAYIGGSRVEVPVGDLRGEAAAELVFARLNHGSGQELEGYRGRSLSVGDSVEIDGVYLRCAPIGWVVVKAA